jgi:Peptidase C10 family
VGADGPYAALVPGNALLGCWSVAFAQVLAFHHLQPQGHVSYRTRRGLAIDEMFDRPVNWDRVVSAIGPQTSAESSRETARYCFAAAAVVQKDFGGGEYRDIDRVPAEVSEHYGCAVARVASGLADTARSELRSSRPVVAYFNNILGLKIVRTGHAAVLDGLAEANGRLLIHGNFGWNSTSDGWYDFGRLAEDRDLLYVFRVVP